MLFLNLLPKKISKQIIPRVNQFPKWIKKQNYFKNIILFIRIRNLPQKEILEWHARLAPNWEQIYFKGRHFWSSILRKNPISARAASLKNSSFICTTSKDRKQTPSTSTTCVCCEACYGRRHLLNSKCHCHHYYESSRRSRHSNCTLNHIIASCCFALGSKLRILRRSIENQPQQNLPETNGVPFKMSHNKFNFKFF